MVVSQIFQTLFLVTVVWKCNGTKWFPSKIGDDPAWAKYLVNKQYRIGVAKVRLSKDFKLEYISTQVKAENGGVEHMVNVHDCYKMVVLSDIHTVYGEVNI